MNKQTNYKH